MSAMWSEAVASVAPEALRDVSPLRLDTGAPGRKRIKHGQRRRCPRTSLRNLPNELLAQITSWLGHRDVGAALVASRRFHVIDQRRLYDTLSPVGLASMGCLQGLVYKHAVDPWSVDTHCLDVATAAGRTDVVRWIVDASAGGGCSTRVLVEAARAGHIPLMEWAINTSGATVVMEALDAAIECGRAEAVRFLWSGRHRSLHWDEHMLDCAANSGNLDTVRFVYEHCLGARCNVSSALWRAVCANAVDCVEWLSEHCTSALQASSAFEASLTHLHRDCGIAILARWPGAACLIEIHTWQPWLASPLITLDRIKSAVSSSATPFAFGPFYADLVDGRLSTSAAYDMLFDACLGVFVDTHTRQNGRLCFGTRLTCDDVFAWCVEHDTYRGRDLVFVGEVLVDGRDAFYGVARLKMRSMSFADLGRLWFHLAGHVKAMERAWQWVAPSGAQTVDQCDADRGDFVEGAQALLSRCQTVANKAAEASSIATLDWLRTKCGTRAHCTNRALQLSLERGCVDVARRLFADGAHLCLHRPDRDDRICVHSHENTCATPLCDIETGESVIDRDTVIGAAGDNHRPVFELLRERGILFKEGQEHVDDAAAAAISAGHVSLASWLITTFGARLDHNSMRIAASRRDLCAVRFMLHAGVEFDADTRVFCDAVVSGSLAIVQTLHKHCPNSYDAQLLVRRAAECGIDDIASWIRAQHASQ